MVTTDRIRSYVDTGVRLAADMIMVNVSLAFAMLARYFIEVTWVEGSLSRHMTFPSRLCRTIRPQLLDSDHHLHGCILHQRVLYPWTILPRSI